ncbi:MAG: carbon-nitrogen hydrolase family protein [Promethearchaeota archaeon]
MLKISCLQPEVLQNRINCHKEIEDILNKIVQNHENCDLICLPERWLPFSKDLSKAIQNERGNDYNFIKNLAKDYNVNIIAGAIWEKRKNFHKPFITSYYFNNQGEEIGRQDKIHLYAYEREIFDPGNELVIFQEKKISFAILICFDIAFFETPRLAVENGSQILFSPTQIREEGMDNWEIYLKARALENRIPIVACNTLGKLYKRKFIGKSKIISFIKGYISPSQLKIIEGPNDSSGYAYDELDLKFTNKLRKLRLNQVIKKSMIKIRQLPY